MPLKSVSYLESKWVWVDHHICDTETHTQTDDDDNTKNAKQNELEYLRRK